MTREELLSKTKSLVAIPSVSGDEGAIADWVENEVRSIDGLSVERIGNNVVARSFGKTTGRVLLGGHLDTVPPVDGQVLYEKNGLLYGRGAADMKGGLAVMLALANCHNDFSYDLTFCFYANEEVARNKSGLLEIQAFDESLLEADVAILGEPTSGLIEAGCQGTIRLKVVLNGKAAHSARPFAGMNAVHRMLPLLDEIVRYQPEVVSIDGCEYGEQLQVVEINGGKGANVLPDSAVLRMNYRFAPSKSEQTALSHLTDLVFPHLDKVWNDGFEVEDSAPGALPSLTQPIVAKLLSETKRPPVAKVGWTDVAFFQGLGIPATNFGPGDPLLAHSSTEHVSSKTLNDCFECLHRVLN